MRILGIYFFLIAGAFPAFAEGGAFPPFYVHSFPGQLFWLFLIFSVLYILMSRVALPNIASILDSRREKIDGELRLANEAQQKAEETARAFEASLRKAKSEARVIAEESRAKSSRDIEAKKQVIEKELTDRISSAEVVITQTKVKAMSYVEDIAQTTAKAMLEKLVGGAGDIAIITDALRVIQQKE